MSDQPVYDDEPDAGSVTEDDTPKSIDSDALGASEAAGADSGASGGGAEAEEASNFKFKNDRKAINLRGLSSRKSVWVGGAGGFLGILLLIVVLFLIGQFKVVSFANVLSTAGYARFNGIFKERMTQNIFDANVVAGDGTVTTASLRSRTLRERMTGKNLNDDLAQMGRDDQFKLTYKNGELAEFRIGDQNISLDGVAKEFYGNTTDYKSASTTQKFKIRSEIASRTENAIGETFASEPKYIRSQVFGTISDNLGFKFSRWRNAARDYFGKDALDAEILNKLNAQAEVNGDTAITTGVDSIDGPAKAVKAADRIKENLTENGGVFNEQELVDTIVRQGTTAGKIGNVVSKLSTAVLVASLACMAREAFNKIPEVYDQNVKTAQRQGLSIQAAGDQVKAGGVVGEAVGALSQQLDGGENSQFYQRAVGLAIDGNSAIPRLKPLVSPTVLALINLGTGGTLGGEACKAILNPVGAITFGVASIVIQGVLASVSGGSITALQQGGEVLAAQILMTALKDAVFEAGGELLSAKSVGLLAGVELYGLGLQYIVKMLAGTGINGASQGAEYVTSAFVGARLGEDTRMGTIYGAPITPAEANKSEQTYLGLAKQHENDKGVFNRYFATSNPFSLTNMAVMQSPSSFTSLGNSLRSSLTKIGNIFQPQTYFNTFLGSTKQSASAADFNPFQGSTPLGFSDSEVDKMRNDETYSSIKNPDYLTDKQITDFDEKYEDCFDPTTLPHELEDLQANDGLCSAKELHQEIVFRYRLYKFDQLIAEQTNTTLSDKPHDLSSGASTATSSTPQSGTPLATDPNLSGPCAAGTTDLGIPTDAAKSAWLSGRPITVRLCGLPNLKSGSSESQPGTQFYIDGANGNAIVNAGASNNFFQLMEAARAAGIPLGATSSFRTMAHQTSLYIAPHQNPVAVPGTSNHQGGQAIDFSCNGGSVDSNGVCFKWLSQNAGKFGIKNLPSESWHWSTTGG